MIPADERFAGVDVATVEGDDRLEHQLEFVAIQRAAQAGLDLVDAVEPLLERPVEAGCPVAPRSFGFVEREVGMLHQFVHVAAILWRDGIADRSRDLEMMVGQIEAMGKIGDDFLRDRRCGDAIGIGTDDDEFVAAETGDPPPPLHHVGQTFRHGAQQPVADHMAERIVDLLEPVDIHPQDGDGIGVLFCGFEDFAQTHLHRHAVFEASQIVVACEPLEFLGQ